VRLLWLNGEAVIHSDIFRSATRSLKAYESLSVQNAKMFFSQAIWTKLRSDSDVHSDTVFQHNFFELNRYDNKNISIVFRIIVLADVEPSGIPG
jgi:hypothetical protein